MTSERASEGGCGCLVFLVLLGLGIWGYHREASARERLEKRLEAFEAKQEAMFYDRRLNAQWKRTTELEKRVQELEACNPKCR